MNMRSSFTVSKTAFHCFAHPQGVPDCKYLFRDEAIAKDFDTNQRKSEAKPRQLASCLDSLERKKIIEYTGDNAIIGLYFFFAEMS